MSLIAILVCWALVAAVISVCALGAWELLRHPEGWGDR